MSINLWKILWRSITTPYVQLVPCDLCNRPHQARPSRAGQLAEAGARWGSWLLQDCNPAFDLLEATQSTETDRTLVPDDRVITPFGVGTIVSREGCADYSALFAVLSNGRPIEHRYLYDVCLDEPAFADTLGAGNAPEPRTPPPSQIPPHPRALRGATETRLDNEFYYRGALGQLLPDFGSSALWPFMVCILLGSSGRGWDFNSVLDIAV